MALRTIAEQNRYNFRRRFFRLASVNVLLATNTLLLQVVTLVAYFIDGLALADI